ncbi:hypothetical protein OT109_04015 [Phycisphaeraceae bacterium D3-23]
MTVALVASVLLLPLITCSGWCFYDGAVTYPEGIERWEAYEAVGREYAPEDRQSAWAQVARSNGWPLDVPEQRGAYDVLTQYIMGSVCSAITLAMAIAAAVFFWLSRSRPQNVYE